jgi:hypothetical protein
MAKLAPGVIVRFSYSHPPEYVDEGTGERHKEVLVLHNNWHGRVHALDLKRMTTAQREVLHAILDEKTIADVKSGKRHRLPLVNDIIRRLENPLEVMKNPVMFYTRFVSVFLRTAGDCYRMYHPKHMSLVTVVKNTDVRGKVINPTPMFGQKNVFAPSEPKKAEPIQGPPTPKDGLDAIKARAQAKKEPAPKPAKPVNRLDVIRQRVQQKKDKT